MLRKVALILAGMGVAGAVAPAPMAQTAPGVTADKIKIGLQADLTGSSAGGIGGRYGAEMAAAEINAHGGINGRKIELVVVDSASTPDGGLLAMRKLVEEEVVLAIQSMTSSNSVLSTLPYIESTGVPLLVTNAGDPRIIDPFRANVFEGASLPVRDALQCYVDYFVKNKVPSVSILATDLAYSVSVRDMLVATLPGKGVKVDSVQMYPYKATDFSAQVQALKQVNSRYVFTVGLPSDTTRFLAQAKRADLASIFWGDDAQADPELIRLGKSLVEGYTTFWYATSHLFGETSGPMKDWEAAFAKFAANAPAGIPNTFTPQDYADMYVLAEAIRRDGANPTQAGVIRQLESIKDFTAGEDEHFTYAHPVGMPRTFAKDKHWGTSGCLPVVVHDGKFTPADR